MISPKKNVKTSKFVTRESFMKEYDNGGKGLKDEIADLNRRREEARLKRLNNKK